MSDATEGDSPADELRKLHGHFDEQKRDVRCYIVHPDTADEYPEKMAALPAPVRETEHIERGKLLPVPELQVGPGPITFDDGPDAEETPDFITPYIYR